MGKRSSQFVFLRHGETDWNNRGLSQGRTDIPLNEIGIAQAHGAARILQGRGIARIVSSTLNRAQHTTRIIADALSLEYTTDSELQEACFGEQEGRPIGPWYDDWVAATCTPPAAEPFASVQIRSVCAVNRAVAAPGLVLIVAHGAMFRALRAAMGLSALVRTQNALPLLCSPGVPWTIEVVR